MIMNGVECESLENITLVNDSADICLKSFIKFIFAVRMLKISTNNVTCTKAFMRTF